MNASRAAARSAAALGVLLAAVLVLAGCAGAHSSTVSRSGAASAGAPVTRAHHAAPARAGAASSAPAGAGASSGTTTAPADGNTVVHTFTPWSDSGTLTVSSSGTARGSCFTTSLAAPSPTAYRCFAGNTLLDPCFLSPTSTRTVACLAAPWDGARVLTLPAAPPAPIRTGTGRFWALVLADGTRCVADTGTVPQVAGVNLSYACADGTHAEPVDPAATQLEVVRGRLDARTLTHIAVTAVWRA